MAGTYKNILVSSVNWLGDVIFSTPVFRNIKQNCPGARVSCLAVPRVAEILECCPDVDEILVYEEKGRHRGLLGKGSIIRELRRRKFDAAFFLRPSLSRATLAWAAGIPARIGTARKGRWFLTSSVEPLPEDRHRSDQYLGLLEGIGWTVPDRTCRLAVPAPAGKSVRSLLSSKGIEDTDRIAVFHVGGNWDLKRWPRENFVPVAEGLQARSLRVVISGGKGDAPDAEWISGRSGRRPVVLAGQTDLKQLLALMDRASVVISADSGPLHLASAAGTPVVGIFGPTRPEVTGPRGAGRCEPLINDVGCNRAPCYYLECPDNVCMKSVKPDDVLQAAFRCLDGRRPV
ncbi:MAG: lipopolysaccharide heptosyltransferase II [Candidatus Omnitrophota bacterium]|nr:lipopolysaccharide heptosyltransferase II [Candidatus Omnitrophota bacterium]MDZ4243254.1 lipopolysaccharide heptosyltransferase II [Candidatus Omnitrophota bacterium]